MFHGQGDSFDPPQDLDGGPFAGDPPMLGDAFSGKFPDDLGDSLDAGVDAPAKAEDSFLAVGLHFFEDMRSLK